MIGRWIRFLLAIGVGIGLGLVYGWIINPVTYVETTPDTLRVDYRADYVLMVAEAYANEQDLPAAVRRLALLGGEEPADTVAEAIQFARQQGYNASDLDRMGALDSALQALYLNQGAAP